MFFSAIGIDHHVDAQTREKFAFSDTQKVEFSALLAEKGIFETVILSTCNRSEVYAFAQGNDHLTADLLGSYSSFFGINSENYDIPFYEGRDAVRHLFRVAAGLESAIVGEDEIFRQVKESFEDSQKFGNTGKVSNHLFQAVLRCAKEIKSTLKISEIPVSPGYIGLKFLEKEVGSFSDKKMLIMGFGEIGQKFYRYAQEYGIEQVVVCNRSEERAMKVIGNAQNAIYRPFAYWKDLIQDADIVITATRCPHHIIKKEQMEAREKPLYLLDMSIPRNIESGVGELSRYHVYNVDALTITANENMAARKELSKAGETIIDSYVEAFFDWLSHLKEDEVIESLNQSVERIMENHLGYLFAKIDVNDKEKSIISRTMQAAMRKALMTPIVSLKSMEDKAKRQAYSKAMEELFDLKREV
jgi:glutamyl-tRNA reductase